MLVEIVRDAGSAVKSGEVIAIIDTEAAATVAASSPAPAAAAAVPAPAAAVPPAAARAMPSAAKLMSEQGIDPASVQGSGRGGRVTKGDVLAHGAPSAQPTAVATAAQSQVTLSGGRPSAWSSRSRVPPR
ncbi:MAG: hypothetical protein EBT40_05005 [Betaproteobacteria bacterium]|nr:hypothetical protein [Betaproteobacteria bacterium]